MHARVLVTSILLASSTAIASDDRLVGWSKDNSFYAVYGTSCADAVVLLCPIKGATPTWPAKYGAADGDACLASYENPDLLELDADALAKLAPVKGGAGPAGVKVTASAKGDIATVTVAKGATKLTFTVEDVPGAKLEKAIWRPDGKQVAVSLKLTRHGICRAAPDHAVAVFDVAELGAPAVVVDHAAAKAANLRGMTALGKHDYAGAAAAFRDAIKADPGFLVAHYNLASVTSVLGELATARAELETIQKAGTAEAKKILAKAKTDPDLDFASTDPQVRKLIGVPAYPADAVKRLTERNATWSSEGPGCDSQTGATLMLKFGKAADKARNHLAITPFCSGAAQTTADERWSPSKLELAIENSVLFDDPNLKLTWARCPDSEVDGSCFQVSGRTFHRGVPRTR